jgi:hypothetical protein
VLYDGVDNRLYTYSLSTKELSETPVTGDVANSMRITGLGFTQSGHIYASFMGPGDVRFASRGLFELVPADAANFDWQPVPGTFVDARSAPEWHVSGSIERLLGCDGNDLVYRIQQDKPFPVILMWSHR